MKKIKSCMVLDNLNIAVFDEQGFQMPQLQQSVISLWCAAAVKAGYDPEGVTVETTQGNWKIYKTLEDDRWSYIRVPVLGYTIDKNVGSITCHICGMTSFNPNDVQNHFCGHCKVFLDDYLKRS